MLLFYSVDSIRLHPSTRIRLQQEKQGKYPYELLLRVDFVYVTQTFNTAHTFIKSYFTVLAGL
jgi:hypothetical protein